MEDGKFKFGSQISRLTYRCSQKEKATTQLLHLGKTLQGNGKGNYSQWGENGGLGHLIYVEREVAGV